MFLFREKTISFFFFFLFNSTLPICPNDTHTHILFDSVLLIVLKNNNIHRCVLVPRQAPRSSAQKTWPHNTCVWTPRVERKKIIIKIIKRTLDDALLCNFTSALPFRILFSKNPTPVVRTLLRGVSMDE